MFVQFHDRVFLPVFFGAAVVDIVAISTVVLDMAATVKSVVRTYRTVLHALWL